MSLTRACLCILRCLKDEKDWKVLGFVLEKLPMSLQNKGMLTRYGKDISKFAAVLCSLFSQSHPVPNINTPHKFGRPELQSAMYPVLAAIASYNRSLDQEMQKRLIKCFEYGLLTSKCNQVSSSIKYFSSIHLLFLGLHCSFNLLYPGDVWLHVHAYSRGATEFVQDLLNCKHSYPRPRVPLNSRISSKGVCKF